MRDRLAGRRQGSLAEVYVGMMSFISSNFCFFLFFSLLPTQLNPDGSVDQSDSSPTPPTLPPSCLVTGEQCPEQASLAVLKCSDVPGQSKKKRGFFFKGKKLFRKLGSSKKN